MSSLTKGAQLLREYLDRTGEPMRSFASRVGCGPHALWFHLAGKRRNLSISIAAAIAAATHDSIPIEAWAEDGDGSDDEDDGACDDNDCSENEERDAFGATTFAP